MDIDIDGVLTLGNLRPKWEDLRGEILPFPDIWAEEEFMNLQNSRLNSAVLPEFEQPSDEMSLFLTQLGSRTELRQGEGFRESDFEVPAIKSSEDYLMWLETAGLSTMETMHEMSLRNAGDLIRASRTLLKLADDLEYLRPHNDSHLGHRIINIALWRIYWHALVAEMKTVEESCSPEIRNAGVFVLTTWPYKEFLRLLAGRLLAMAISGIHENGD
ncbi:hypothetical protein M758_1G225100 [Ceratodon purpureus]|nr:hypothetical protein M758_1G225100 [Ceratodon purpureus]